MNYTFKRYYKYCFLVEDENGQIYSNRDTQNYDDIYRFEITTEGTFEEKDGKYFISGLEFEKL